MMITLRIINLAKSWQNLKEFAGCSLPIRIIIRITY
jgi:hypothetical protein